MRIFAGVTAMIESCVVVMNLETVETQLLRSVFLHPTLPEMMKEAVLDTYGQVQNIRPISE